MNVASTVKCSAEIRAAFAWRTAPSMGACHLVWPEAVAFSLNVVACELGSSRFM